MAEKKKTASKPSSAAKAGAVVAEAPSREASELTPEWQQEFLGRLRLEKTRIPNRFLSKSLDNFNTLRNARRKAVVQAATAYVQAFNFKSMPPQGLILEGVVGCGKTHVAVAILKGVVAKGYSGLYYNMPDLLSDIRSTYSDNATLSEHELLQTVNEPDLLVLDDLGAEKTAEWVNDRLYLIINRRYESSKPILVTTNLNLRELTDKLGERIASRLCELCHEPVEFPDEDYRKKTMR